MYGAAHALDRPPLYDRAVSSTVPSRDVYSVGRLNREVRLLLEAGIPPVWVEGEISNLSMYSSGHWYFTLKDADAQIRCAMFRQRNQYLRFKPRDGLRVQVRGRVGLYETRGDFQLVVEQMEEGGEGALRREFELLKQRLAAEGLFDAARKRALPALPRRIAVVTSAQGAALHDVLHILALRFPAAAVRILPVPVQGVAAAPAIARALGLRDWLADCDVLILARGGGSLEDLWSFNDERVARAIVACPIPVISGVGHETDVTIADFAADVRAPTPSGAAQLATPDRHALLQQLAAQRQRLQQSLRRQLERHLQHQGALLRRLQLAHPGARLRQQSQRLDELERRLRRAVTLRLGAARQRQQSALARLQRVHPARQLLALEGHLDRLRKRLRGATGQVLSQRAQQLALAVRSLQAISPLATLERGYAIARTRAGVVLHDPAQVVAGEEIELRLARGSLVAIVKGSG